MSIIVMHADVIAVLRTAEPGTEVHCRQAVCECSRQQEDAVMWHHITQQSCCICVHRRQWLHLIQLKVKYAKFTSTCNCRCQQRAVRAAALRCQSTATTALSTRRWVAAAVRQCAGPLSSAHVMDSMSIRAGKLSTMAALMSRPATGVHCFAQTSATWDTHLPQVSFEGQIYAAGAAGRRSHGGNC
jgi:hypothetical protein